MSWTVSNNPVGELPTSEPVVVESFVEALSVLNELVSNAILAAIDTAPTHNLSTALQAIQRADDSFDETFGAACDREVEPQEISFCVLDHVYFAKKVN